MISSEVHRTLVKSPPELWAELSDPGALARHLGDLGEIRVTRVEPEQLVEWEAENRSGTVQIKPSGWGTRVTLTVASEIPDATPSDAPPPAAGPEVAADSSSHDASQPETEPPAQIEGEAEPEAAALAPTASGWQDEPDPASHVESDPAWPTEGGPAFAPLAMPALEATEEPEGELQAEPAETEVQGTSAEAEPVEAEPYAWLADEDPQPRRGFFARLFGRRRRPRALGPDSHEVPLDAIAAEEGSLEPAEDELAPGGWEPDADERHEEPQAHDAADALLEPQPEALLEPESETTRDGEPQIVAAEEAARQAQASDQAADIAADLKAAEEIADAEVTAVLTSVLDRLGAAHHRPFSRS
jgi:hypothetical protein